MNFFNASISDLCQGIIDKTVDKERRIEYLEEENKNSKMSIIKIQKCREWQPS